MTRATTDHISRALASATKSRDLVKGQLGRATERAAALSLRLRSLETVIEGLTNVLAARDKLEATSATTVTTNAPDERIDRDALEALYQPGIRGEPHD